MSRPKCSNHPQVNIHWIHCIGNFFTIQVFWTTCTCPEKHIWSEILHCIKIFSIIQDFWVTYVCPENFTVLNILFTFRIFEQLALALKNRVCLEFTYWKHIFIIQDFWTTCSCAGKQSCPEIFHCFEILKYFLLFRNFEQLALVLKTEFALKFFTGLKYFLSFKNFEQFAHALKTEFALKFFKPRDGSLPRPPALESTA